MLSETTIDLLKQLIVKSQQMKKLKQSKEFATMEEKSDLDY